MIQIRSSVNQDQVFGHAAVGLVAQIRIAQGLLCRQNRRGLRLRGGGGARLIGSILFGLFCSEKKKKRDDNDGDSPRDGHENIRPLAARRPSKKRSSALCFNGLSRLSIFRRA